RLVGVILIERAVRCNSYPWKEGPSRCCCGKESRWRLCEVFARRCTAHPAAHRAAWVLSAASPVPPAFPVKILLPSQLCWRGLDPDCRTGGGLQHQGKNRFYNEGRS